MPSGSCLREASKPRVFRDVGAALCKPRRWLLSWRSHIALATLGHRALRWLRRTTQAKGRCRPFNMNTPLDTNMPKSMTSFPEAAGIYDSGTVIPGRSFIWHELGDHLLLNTGSRPHIV